MGRLCLELDGGRQSWPTKRGTGRRLYHEPPQQRRPGLVERLDDAVRVLALWRRRIRERHVLARLDHRMLRDIGVSPSDAERECNKPFWR